MCDESQDMVTDEWRNGRHVVYRLHAHIVLAPLDRVKEYIDNQQSPNRSPGRPRRR